MFVLALLAGAFGLLAGTMTANYTLDPQYVFGTPLTRHDENANFRLHRVRAYQAQRDHVDALLFASSRGRAFEAGSMAHKMRARAVAKFDVTAGMITDHLPALEYVLHDKAARGDKIKTALLLLDVDTFGKLPSTNVNIDSFLPPELSGESPARFWWRYLTVFQFRMWRGIIAHRMRGGDKAAPAPQSSFPNINHAMRAEFVPAGSSGGSTSFLRVADDVPAGGFLVNTRPNLAAHLRLVSRFVSLCRDSGIQLTVATTPMRADAASLYDRADLHSVVQRLSEIVPLWDFTAPRWIAADIAFWDDPSHFKPAVAEMMLDRMFGSDGPQDFGVLRSATAQAALKAGPRKH